MIHSSRRTFTLSISGFLKGFQKVSLNAGESKEVSFRITTDALKFFNSALKYDWESGEFIIHVGTNSRDVTSAKVNWVK